MAHPKNRLFLIPQYLIKVQKNRVEQQTCKSTQLKFGSFKVDLQHVDTALQKPSTKNNMASKKNDIDFSIYKDELFEEQKTDGIFFEKEDDDNNKNKKK